MPSAALRVALLAAGLLALLGTAGAEGWLPVGLSPARWQASIPASNPVTPAKVALGRLLFMDTRLSRRKDFSCRSCHSSAAGLSQGRTQILPRGVPLLRRAPTLFNAMFAPRLMWDGRAGSLERQARIPIFNPCEMGMASDQEMVRRIQAVPEYRSRFQQAFQGPPTPARIAAALASFERTLVSTDAPFDRYVHGDPQAMPLAARRGWALFKGRAGCIECHAWTPASPFFTDFSFHNLGVGKTDPGLFGFTRRPRDMGAFKTPTLRNVELTAPYMHDGSLKTLRQVLEFHNRGGTPNPFLDHRMRPLNLSADDMGDLEMFLCQLTGKQVRWLSHHPNDL